MSICNAKNTVTAYSGALSNGLQPTNEAGAENACGFCPAKRRKETSKNLIFNTFRLQIQMDGIMEEKRKKA